MSSHTPFSLTSSALACAPVTALAFLSASHLLVAQGPLLKLYSVGTADDAASSLLCTERVLSINRIHGIVRCKDARGEEFILVFGGKEVATIQMASAGEDRQRPQAFQNRSA